MEGHIMVGGAVVVGSPASWSPEVTQSPMEVPGSWLAASGEKNASCSELAIDLVFSEQVSMGSELRICFPDKLHHILH